jgi:hypothetical protein
MSLGCFQKLQKNGVGRMSLGCSQTSQKHGGGRMSLRVLSKSVLAVVFVFVFFVEDEFCSDFVF